MRILAINSSAHMDPREAGSIGRVIAEKGAALDWWQRGSGPLPAFTGDHDGLILFGGEMSVYDPAYKDYFDSIGALARTYHEAGRPILGSCLGAQILAYAFGAAVFPGPVEYGFARLSVTEEGAKDPLLSGQPPHLDLFEMHGDTFDLPAGARLLARGDAVANQIFRIGRATYGFQCHFEATPEIAEYWSSRHAVSADRLTAFVERDRQAMQRDFMRHQAAQLVFAEHTVARWLALS